MALCEACEQEERIYHVTVTVEVFGPKGSKRKLVQFWLGEKCERGNQQILAQDLQRRKRMALRMSAEPEFCSKYPAWRERRAKATLFDAIQSAGAE